MQKYFCICKGIICTLKNKKTKFIMLKTLQQHQKQ